MRSSCTFAPSGSSRARSPSTRPWTPARTATPCASVTWWVRRVLEELQDKENRLLIRRLVSELLTPREADIIRRRYGLDGRVPQTQRQVAAAYHISRSYVSRLEKKALLKLETALRSHI